MEKVLLAYRKLIGSLYESWKIDIEMLYRLFIFNGL